MGIPGADKVNVEVNVDKVVVTGDSLTQAEKEKIIVAAGNVKGISSVDDKTTVTSVAVEARFYNVVSGDTLSAIAKKEYGNANDYNKIFRSQQADAEPSGQDLPGPEAAQPAVILRLTLPDLT